ncbi:hypothetical protein HW532_15620 [Kaustia mangrovi]|uniref:Uncharacterized protein n=1 Tax=Kaustia mangrovi TaxID=2593653 RepID=A0A7S8HD65_9HYPH|nr:hypothetical protein [Kaustia mangrovi]QPC43993.1 hypothetical protein HW532_15620 [Kaustia mangrovi]
MTDPISRILREHIALEKRKIEQIHSGMRLDGQTDLDGVITTTEEEALKAIAQMEGALKRHEERNPPED